MNKIKELRKKIISLLELAKTIRNFTKYADKL